jgi:hypothetical protein
MGISLTQILELSFDVASKLGAIAGGFFSIYRAGISFQTQTPIAADTLYDAPVIFTASAGAQVASGIFHSIRQHGEIQKRRLHIAEAAQDSDALTALFIRRENGLDASESVVLERGASFGAIGAGAAMITAGFYEFFNHIIISEEYILVGCAIAAFGVVGLKHSYDRELSDVVTVEQGMRSGFSA